jgi:hypothetical protein
LSQRSNRLLIAISGAAALSLLVAAAAMAARIVGDDGPNTLEQVDDTEENRTENPAEDNDEG